MSVPDERQVRRPRYQRFNGRPYHPPLRLTQVQPEQLPSAWKAIIVGLLLGALLLVMLGLVVLALEFH